MSIFKPGFVLPSHGLKRPMWPSLQAGEIGGGQLSVDQWHGGSRGPRSAGSELTSSMLDQAHREAAELLRSAAEEAEEAIRLAHREGYEAGLKLARAEADTILQDARRAVDEARSEAAAILQAAEAQAAAVRSEAERERSLRLAAAEHEATDLLAEAQGERNRLLESAQASLVDLASTAATRIVQGHLAIQPASIQAMISAGLRRLRDSNCTARISPEDLPLLQAHRAAMERELGNGVLVLQCDESLQQGSYILHSPVGSVDATVEQQAQVLRTAMNLAIGAD